MSDHGALHRAASTVRCAVAGKPMRRFVAPDLGGPTPQCGRVLEMVEAHRRGVRLIWDDGLALDTHVRHASDWQVFRLRDGWRAPAASPGIMIETDGWAATCGVGTAAESFQLPDRRRHPGMGAPGPDLTDPDAPLSRAVERLLSYPTPEIPIADALLDSRIARGVGNAYRSEALWAAELSPFAPVCALDVDDVERLMIATAETVAQHIGTNGDAAMHVYGRNGRQCHRCGTSVSARSVGHQHQTIYWCQECQHRYDPFVQLRDDTPTMDPHPAAAKFLADLPWNRSL